VRSFVAPDLREREDMTADHDKTGNPPPSDVPVDVATPAPMISRRMLLRGASAAVPTILTLQSGAALATTSSMMIGTAPSSSGAMNNGNVQCLEMKGSWTGNASLSQLDVSNDPNLHVQLIPYRDPVAAPYYRSYLNSGGQLKPTDTTVGIDDMCSEGGFFFYKDGGITGQAQLLGNGQQLKAGFLVSSTALASFSSYLTPPTQF